MSLDEYLLDFATKLDQIHRDLQSLNARVSASNHLIKEKISYSLTEAAAATGLSRVTLFEKCKAGKIPYQQAAPGSSITVSKHDLEKFMESNSSKSVLPGKLNGRAGKIVKRSVMRAAR